MENQTSSPGIMETYQNDHNRDSFFRNLPHRYEITKIVRENKDTKHKEVIYQSMEAEQREKSGIYHTVDMLNDSEALLGKCADKREKKLVTDFFALWEERRNGI